MNILLIACGGALGAVLRFLAGSYGVKFFTTTFPYSTLLINVIGCFLAGLLFSYSRTTNLSEPIKLFLMTGILGGFTTFSAFSVETLDLLNQGRSGAALSYMIISLGSTVLAVYIGSKIL